MRATVGNIFRMIIITINYNDCYEILVIPIAVGDF